MNIFIGRFKFFSGDSSFSAGGYQVQSEIIKLLHDKFDGDAKVISMRPSRSWPFDSFFYSQLCVDNTVYLPYVNIYGLRSIFFCFGILYYCLKWGAAKIFIYNSYLFENITLLLVSFINKSPLIIFIQDINIDFTMRSIKRSIRSCYEYSGLFFARFFDVIVPVSMAIVKDFRFNKDKCIVFQGGAFPYNFRLYENNDDYQEGSYAVYGGALEPYNGVMSLIDAWIDQDIRIDLHIFGKGSLSDFVNSASASHAHIIYHGFISQDRVLNFQKNAKYNFCFRYDVGINQSYFFPSKFFNIVSFKGYAVVNDFIGIPLALRDGLNFVNNDFSNLSFVLNNPGDRFFDYSVRMNGLLSDNYWPILVSNIIERIDDAS